MKLVEEGDKSSFIFVFQCYGIFQIPLNERVYNVIFKSCVMEIVELKKSNRS